MLEKKHFPFGQELKKVEQKDRSPKQAFVLGVYASAVHARWIDKVQKPGVLTTFGRSEYNNNIYLTISDLTPAIYGHCIPAKSGHGH